MIISRLNLILIWLLFLLLLLLLPKNSGPPLPTPEFSQKEIQTPSLKQTGFKLGANLKNYLQTKKSPLAEEVDYLLTKPNWKLVLAITRIESQFCTRALGNNCWGIKAGANYAKYATLQDGIAAADSLIAKWQARGRWLTVEDMSCSYVVPCSGNWVTVTKKTLIELNQIEEESMEE